MYLAIMIQTPSYLKNVKNYYVFSLKLSKKLHYSITNLAKYD